jgi:eukaryotic-like serine/threonine-protein kinase
MSPTLTQDGVPALDRADRLDSWKEIAAYLNRSVQTAQRWEKREGLPVRRHTHERQDSVYAYRSELDRWRDQRGAHQPPDAEPRPEQLASPIARRWSLAPLLSIRRVALSGAAIVVLGAIAGWQFRAARVRHARQVTLPRIESTVRSDNSSDAFFLAYRLASDARRYVPGDSRLESSWDVITRTIDVTSEPEGARLTVSSYGGGDTIELGATPRRTVRVPRSVLHWRVQLDGYDTAEGVFDASTNSLQVVLDRTGVAPAGMVRARGGRFELGLTHLGQQPPFDLADYWIDRYEITNREYRKFVDAGGYSEPRYWTQPFIQAGRALSFTEAMQLFRDRTGRPGPATWAAGDFPQGAGDQPVTGVSWYEAMAYAAFAGKSLPTIFHWVRAAGIPANSEIVPRSNFSGDGLAPVGRFRGMNAVGTYDMAGNAKEWCFNATGQDRFILGGAWDEPLYTFNEADGQSAFSRADNFGFRLVTYITPPAPSLLRAVDYPRRDFSREKPVPNAEFERLRAMYAYRDTPLRASVDSVDDSDEHWRKERVTLDAAYGGERITAYVFLPRHGSPPFQTVVYFPGSSGIQMRSSHDLQPPFDGAIIKSGRALIFPIYKGTFERGDSLATDYPAASEFYREHVIDWYQDLARTVDYVETRSDLDASHLAYLGFSWGARLGPLFAALDDRFKTVMLVSGGLKFARSLPEADPLNFASHVTVPVLMVNGRYDFFFPLETSQQPLLELLGTRTSDKRHVVLDSGHTLPSIPVARELLPWLDRYLGPVPP